MLRSTLLASSLVLCGAASKAAAITYDVSLAVPDESVTGTIQTNGTLGTLATDDILDWQFVVINGALSFTLIGDGQPGDNSDVFISGQSVTATERQLLFDFSGDGFVLFQRRASGRARRGSACRIPGARV